MNLTVINKTTCTFTDRQHQEVRELSERWNEELKLYHVIKLFTEVAKLSGLNDESIRFAVESGDNPEIINTAIESVLQSAANIQIAINELYRGDE